MLYHPGKQSPFQSDPGLALCVFADMTDDDDLAVAIRKRLDAIVRMSGDIRSLSPTSSQYGA